MKDEDIEMIVRDRVLEEYFTTVSVKITSEETRKIAINYITSDIAGLRKMAGDSILTRITPDHVSELAGLLLEGALSSRAAKNILEYLQNGEVGSIRELADKHDLIQKNDDTSIQDLVGALILENAKAVDEYRMGKEASLQFLVGQGMKLSKGSINPSLLRAALISRLKEAQ